MTPKYPFVVHLKPSSRDFGSGQAHVGERAYSPIRFGRVNTRVNTADGDDSALRRQPMSPAHQSSSALPMHTALCSRPDRPRTAMYRQARTGVAGALHTGDTVAAATAERRDSVVAAAASATPCRPGSAAARMLSAERETLQRTSSAAAGSGGVYKFLGKPMRGNKLVRPNPLLSETPSARGRREVEHYLENHATMKSSKRLFANHKVTGVYW